MLETRVKEGWGEYHRASSSRMREHITRQARVLVIAFFCRYARASRLVVSTVLYVTLPGRAVATAHNAT